MGRCALIVKADELEKVISNLESSNSYANIGELCEAVANSDWGKSVRNQKHQVRGISSGFVQAKIREFGIKLKTQAGKKDKTRSKVPRSEKLSGLKGMDYFGQKLMDNVKLSKEPKLEKLAEKALQGNIRACVKLNCMQCQGMTDAYKACNGGTGGVPCALYPLNRLFFKNRKKLVKNKDDNFYTTEFLKELDEIEISLNS